MSAQIIGGKRLKGTVQVSGSKNASLAIITAALLTEEASQIHNVPDIIDVHTMLHLLTTIGVDAHYSPTCDYCGTVSICPAQISHSPPADLVNKIRASILLAGNALTRVPDSARTVFHPHCSAGPLLARCGGASLALPGGCAIGSNNTRPVNLHKDVLTAMGSRIEERDGEFEMIVENGLRGAQVELSYPSVGATCTFLLAAASAQGCSKLWNAACEPEVRTSSHDELHSSSCRFMTMMQQSKHRAIDLSVCH
jgi:UDP-N-acetylglucosamine 1-carboxyvinyltransferase